MQITLPRYRLVLRTHNILDLLYPNRCLHCHYPVQATRLPLCMACMSNLEQVDLAEVKVHLTKHTNAVENLTHVYAHWMFDKTGAVQLVHQALKYQNRPTYGSMLGRYIGRSLHGMMPLDTLPHVIIPIPLHAKRLYERGYNQSLMIAHGISRETRIPIENRAMIRSRHTTTQTGLGQDDRWENVSSAFKITDSKKVAGRHILIVDDVLTTGATLLSAAHTLMASGAHSVSFATLAFARP